MRIIHDNPKISSRRGELRTFLFWGWIKIHRSVKQDSQQWHAIVAHEYKHWEHYKRSWGLHPIRYKFSKSYRYQCELEAYAAEVVSQESIWGALNYRARKTAARLIANEYDLNLEPCNVLPELTAEILSQTS